MENKIIESFPFVKNAKVTKREGIYSDFYELSGEMSPSDAARIIKECKFYLGPDTNAKLAEQAQTVEIEIKKDARPIIPWADLMIKSGYLNDPRPLYVPIGLTTSGMPITKDIAKMPHMLIAGATGQGKSVAINSMICALIKKNTPDIVRLVLVDPKVVEFSFYKKSKHLFFPVLTENKDIFLVLNYLCSEMEYRYNLLEQYKVKNITEYNQLQSDRTMPYLVVVIDEFSDLMMQSSKDQNFEKLIIRLAQKARAAGIHLIISTQRPSADVVTGLIKANFPVRLALKCASNHDSRTIIGEAGAENLLGRGDALLKFDTELVRCHGAYISNEEIMELANRE